MSVLSSVAGDMHDTGFDRDDSEDEDNGDAMDTEEKISASLKHLGNVQRKKRSPLLMKELLGDDGDDAMHGIKKKHLKALARTQNRLDIVRIVNRHFELKLNRRMESLDVVRQQSINKTFTRQSQPWQSKFKEVLSQRRRQVT